MYYQDVMFRLETCVNICDTSNKLTGFLPYVDKNCNFGLQKVALCLVASLFHAEKR